MWCSMQLFHQKIFFSVPFCNFLQGTYICFLGTIEKTVIMHILGVPDICICFAFLQHLKEQ